MIRRLGTRCRELVRPHAGPLLLAFALSALYFILDLRGGDLAAHLYRAELFKDDGFFVWNYNWYGGHYVVSYGVIFPTLSATIGVRLAGALAYLLAVLLFSVLAREVFSREGARASAYVFATVFSATLVIGQLPYALAIAIGLGALLAAAHGRTWVAAFLAVNSALTSPLAALFVSFVAFVVWFGGHPLALLRRIRDDERSAQGNWIRSTFDAVWATPQHAYLAVAVCTLLPAMIVSFLFPEGGSQPFHVASYIVALAMTAVFWYFVRDEVDGDARSTIGIGVILYVIFLTGNELIASPIGGNAIRLGMLIGPVLAAALLWPRAGRYALTVVAILLAWQASTAVWSIATADRTKDAHYFAPVNDFLDRQNPARDQKVEVVFTRNHFEAAYVASRRPIARGWERQLDTKYNALFYDGTLSPESYARWLIDNDVRWVALSEAVTDYSGKGEAELINSGLPYLDRAATFRDWHIYKVNLPGSGGAEPRFRSTDPDQGFTISPDTWGITSTRIRWQRFLRPSYGCIRSSKQEFIELLLPPLGSADARRDGVGVSSSPPVVTITSDFSLDRFVGGGAICADGWTTNENGTPMRQPEDAPEGADT